MRILLAAVSVNVFGGCPAGFGLIKLVESDVIDEG